MSILSFLSSAQSQSARWAKGWWAWEWDVAVRSWEASDKMHTSLQEMLTHSLSCSHVPYLPGLLSGQS